MFKKQFDPGSFNSLETQASVKEGCFNWGIGSYQKPGSQVAHLSISKMVVNP